MKIVIITGIILLSFLVAAFWFGQYIESSCERMLVPLKELDHIVLGEDWDAMQEVAEQVRIEWEQNRKVWIYMLEHYDIDAIDLALVRLDRYIGLRDKEHTTLMVAEITFEVQLINKKESLTLANLF